jgi:hypothetical protein
VAASLRTPEHLALARALGGEAGGGLAALGAGPDPTGG